jgi:uncharacterized protein (DUF924 family)
LDNRANEVLAFWFADALTSAEATTRQHRRWFMQSDEFDRDIAERFGALPVQAAQGQMRAWRQAPASALALVIVLDQFPRSLYRNSARAFAFDAKALAEAQAAIEHGHDDALHPLQSAFFYTPFEHAENLQMQHRSVQLFEHLRERAPAGLAPLFEGFLEYARRHRDVITQFGRFPHRNALIGRSATADEIAYLSGGGETFGVRQADRELGD